MNGEKIVDLTIPVGVTSIGSYVFNNCYSLKSISISSSVTSIGVKAFADCAFLDTVAFSQRLKIISASAFSGCSNLSSLRLPDSVEKIEANKAAFCRMDALDNIVIPDRVTELPTIMDTHEVSIPLYDYIDHGWKSKDSPPASYYEERQMYQDKITDTIHTPYGVFQHMKSLKSIAVPGSVEIIDVCCFANCDLLESVKLQEGTKKIRDYAFAECPKLREVILPHSLEVIERYAFKKCIMLKTVYLSPSIRLIEEGAFEGCNDLIIYGEPNSYAEKMQRKWIEILCI